MCPFYAYVLNFTHFKTRKFFPNNNNKNNNVSILMHFKENSYSKKYFIYLSIINNYHII